MTNTPGRTVMLGNDPQLTENATQKFARKQEEGRRAAEARKSGGYNRDTPPISAEQAETDAAPLFMPEAEQTTAPVESTKPARPIIVLSTTIAYRGRIVTIANDGMTLDQFCDMLDRKFGPAE